MRWILQQWEHSCSNHSESLSLCPNAGVYMTCVVSMSSTDHRSGRKFILEVYVAGTHAQSALYTSYFLSYCLTVSLSYCNCVLYYNGHYLVITHAVIYITSLHTIYITSLHTVTIIHYCHFACACVDREQLGI